jgi:GPH family glycoside/pentoside/hexuronide:cation symporter
LFWFTFAVTRERVKTPKDHNSSLKRDLKFLFSNRPWVVMFFAAIFTLANVAVKNAVTIHFFKYYVGDDGTSYFLFMDRTTLFLTAGMLAMILGVASTRLFTKHFEKKTLMIWLSLLNAASMVIIFLIPADQYWTMMVVNIIGMFLVGPTPALVWAMYADVADYGEWKYRRRTTGLVFSAAQFAQKFGLTLGGGLSGWILGLAGFVANMEQTETSLLGIRLMFTIIPACLATLNACVLIFYSLSDKQVAQIEIELEERKSGVRKNA